MKKCVIIVLFILLSTILIVKLITKNIKLIEAYKIEMYGEPIDLETGTINNKYFNINNEGKDANNTIKGINKAIQYCKKNNIYYFKLQKGTYLINDSINMESNMEFDLNSSKIKYDTNEKIGYNLIKVNSVENVTVKNGILEGDKDFHNYVGNSTHEWGMGVEVISSLNVNLDTLYIYNMTGDAIYVSKYSSIPNSINSENIKIRNCILYDCRRQGISITSGESIEIYNNEIYNIRGTSPQAGIDLEANNDNIIIDDIYIHNNKFYNFASKIGIDICNEAYNVKIEENDIDGYILMYEVKGTLEILNNKLSNGAIFCNPDKEHNGNIINNLYILNNIFSNYKIYHKENVENLKIENNVGLIN